MAGALASVLAAESMSKKAKHWGPKAACASQQIAWVTLPMRQLGLFITLEKAEKHSSALAG
jgi:hypothetical protein